MADVLPFPSLPFEDEPGLPDAYARREALDIQQSFIVEAPAGSGKTGLLIQRFLKLLTDPTVTTPEQVLAITFTRKATAEMRDRVLAYLAQADQQLPVRDSEFDRTTRELSVAVLERDRQLRWSLLTQPARLRIRTIDSLCADIARMLPVLSGSGGQLAPVEQAAPLHREAARRTLLLLGSDDLALHRAIRELLLHRDGNISNCEELIAEMLSLREQWGQLIWGMVSLQQRHKLDDAYLDQTVLPRLEAAMEQAICALLQDVQRIFPPDVLEDLVGVVSEIVSTAGPADLSERVLGCIGRTRSPVACSADLEYWRTLVHILTTQAGEWRKGLDARVFGVKITPSQKSELQQIMSRLDDRDELKSLLCAVEDLPPAQYPPDQWKVAKALFRVLNRAMVELQLVFAERNQCDFAELSLLARHALSHSSGPEDLAEAVGSRLQHLLVDEMQDTSNSQYELLEVLTRSWDGHSQTVFLVGDPRQSIYLFRQARVERFVHALETQRLGDLPLVRLKLTSNFRSQAKLVHEFNSEFSAIFPRFSDALPYSEANPVLDPSPLATGVEWHANIIPNASRTTDPTLAELQQRQRRIDAEQVVQIAREWLSKPLPESRKKIHASSGQQIPEPWRIAVLVRSRNHLTDIASALKHADIPMRAVNIDALSERQEVLDLTALTRVLMHPADRVAGLAVLRAPWCGLTLADLHLLTGSDDTSIKHASIERLLADRSQLLSAEAQERIRRVQSVLNTAAKQRGKIPTAQLVEKAWRTLGGDVALPPDQRANTARFFELLSRLETESDVAPEISLATLDARLRDLYAEPTALPPETPHVELLTIHKAKGLEWDVVIVPGLERLPDRGRARLLAWTTLDSGDDEASASVMLAPIAARGNDPEKLTKWLNRLHNQREIAEHKRLFYVACTRAREELHLFAAPAEAAGRQVKPRAGSLLSAAWPAAHQFFDQPALPAMEELQADKTVDLAAESSPRRHVRPVLRRIPLSYNPADRFAQAERNRLPYRSGVTTVENPRRFDRPEGSFTARAFGNVIHAGLEVIARRIQDGATADAMISELRHWSPRLTTMLRNDGVSPSTADRLGREALGVLERALADADGRWILSAHAHAESESSLSAVWDGTSQISTIRTDRIFKAGPVPQAAGSELLWIIDYKTSSHSGVGVDTFLQHQRDAYAAQLETYARLLAPAMQVSSMDVRVGLYFPAIPRLVWWSPAGD